MAEQNRDEEDRPLMVQELSTYELRLSLREHIVVILVCSMVALVSFILPSETWWWWLIKGILSLPAIFVGVIRYFMLNGVRQELARRAKANGVGIDELSDQTEDQGTGE